MLVLTDDAGCKLVISMLFLIRSLNMQDTVFLLIQMNVGHLLSEFLKKKKRKQLLDAHKHSNNADIVVNGSSRNRVFCVCAVRLQYSRLAVRCDSLW